MAKKVKRSSTPKTKNAHLGLRLLIIAIWLVLVALLVNSSFLHTLLNQSNTDTSNLIVTIILLVPIATVVFPVVYQLSGIYGIDEKKSVTPEWIRYVISIVGTGISLSILFYLFTITTFALFYKF